MADAMALAQGAVEALLDDEALRGDLSDDGFGPLVEWGTNALKAAAEEIVQSPDAEDETAAEARMAAAGAAVKGVIAAAVQAAQGQTHDDLEALLREPPLERNLLARTRVAMVGMRLGDDPDVNAARIARALEGLRAEG